MLYKFTYAYKNKILTKVCTTTKEADMFFNILISLNVDYIRVITFTKNHF